MKPGGDQIVACPECGELASYMTLMSGNTIGERIWTDGKRFAPMMELPPSVAKCEQCGKCYWLSDAQKVGMVESWGPKRGSENLAWTGAPKVRELRNLRREHGEPHSFARVPVNCREHASLGR